MPLLLNREIGRLKKQLLTLSGHVEQTFDEAVRAVIEHDRDGALDVIDRDRVIDYMEIDVEEECLKIIALHQPVANDLRFIVAVMRINRDLERIGDLAVSIAERSLHLSEAVPPPNIPRDFHDTARRVRTMLGDSLNAMLDLDANAAKAVIAADAAVDVACLRMYDEIKMRIKANPDAVDTLLHLLLIPRHLERIADHASNIAEDVVYMTEGTIVRHNGKNLPAGLDDTSAGWISGTSHGAH